RERPPFELDVLDGDHLLGLPRAVRAVPAEHVAREGSAHEATLGLGVVKPAHLERNQPLLPQVDRLLEPALGEVPEVQPLTVAPGRDILDVEAVLIRVRLAELGGDECVLAWLVPEVVVEWRVSAAVLPAALELERARVEDREAAGAGAIP